jgi:hypothetical protein
MDFVFEGRRRAMNGKMIVLACLIMLVALGPLAYSQSAVPEPSTQAMQNLAPLGIMDQANAWGRKSEENKVTVWTSSHAFNFVFADGSKTVVALPDDRMLVSIAPYIRETHPCSAHYPSSFRGELPNTAVRVKAVSSDCLSTRKRLPFQTESLISGFPAICRST